MLAATTPRSLPKTPCLRRISGRFGLRVKRILSPLNLDYIDPFSVNKCQGADQHAHDAHTWHRYGTVTLWHRYWSLPRSSG